ncbi:MAG: LysR family transcriptional regulator [Pseudomonadota bacterium]
MNLRDLKYIVAVAEYRNFTRAAEVLNISQPALSSQIKKLERDFGLDIFERRKDGVYLSAFGTKLADAAREANAIIDRIEDIAQHFRQIDATPLRLGMTPTLAAYLSRYFIEMMAELFPGMRLIVVEEKPVELARLVETQRIDVALIARKSHQRIFGDDPHVRMEFAPLWLEPLFLGVRSDHWLAEEPGITARSVPRELLIRFDVPFGYDLEVDLPDQHPKAAETLGIDVRTARFETVCRYVAQSDACTIINAIAANQFKQDKLGLAFLPFLDQGNLRELGVISRPNYSRALVVQRMQDFIQKTPPPGTVAYRSEADDREVALAALVADMAAGHTSTDS